MRNERQYIFLSLSAVASGIKYKSSIGRIFIKLFIIMPGYRLSKITEANSREMIYFSLSVESEFSEKCPINAPMRKAGK